ncbi:hypothetical protein EV2_018609 [Malus domestica]
MNKLRPVSGEIRRRQSTVKRHASWMGFGICGSAEVLDLGIFGPAEVQLRFWTWESSDQLRFWTWMTQFRRPHIAWRRRCLRQHGCGLFISSGLSCGDA